MVREVLRVVGLVAVAAALCAPPAHAASQSDNIEVVQSFPLNQGNEIEFDGNRIYVSEYTDGDVGINAFELRRGKVFPIGRQPCPGHTDAAALDDDHVAVALQGYMETCTQAPLVPVPGGGTAGGVHVMDFSDPARPRLRGSVLVPGGVHTLTRYPGEPYVYASVGGADQYGSQGGYETIVDVSDPDEPVIAATYRTALNPFGCHDVAFERIDGDVIGFCPGQGGTEIWDASDPLDPKPISRIALPALQLPHMVAVSSDGKMAAISDEAYVAHACNPASPVGALWLYDISDLANPELLGFYGPPRGFLPVGSLSGVDTSCTAHNFNFIPGTRLIVTAWVSGGTNVIDVGDPAAPVEVAHYQPNRTIAMSSYWYRGKIFVGDFDRGLDVLELDRSVLQGGRSAPEARVR